MSQVEILDRINNLLIQLSYVNGIFVGLFAGIALSIFAVWAFLLIDNKR